MSITILGFFALVALIFLGAVAGAEAAMPTWSVRFWRFIGRLLDR